MTKIAYLFPGQGSQAVGMGADLAANSKAARDVFDLADDLLGVKISTICFYGPEETLKETVNTQPALFLTSVAALAALHEAGAPGPDVTAGHSVGEYAALVASGALTLETGLPLVYRRATEMQRTAQAAPGTMAAVLGMAAEDVVTVCRDAELATGKPVDPANFNGAGQVVISGDPDAVAKASALASERGAKRVIELKVSGAFHSRLMADAAKAMKTVLAGATVHDASIPVVANRTADYVRSSDAIKSALAEQIDHSVRWEETMRRLVADGCDLFVEVGSGSVLTGLAKRAAPEARLYTVGDSAGVAKFVQEAGAR